MPKSKAKRPIVSVHAPPSSRGPQPGGEPQQHKQQGKHQHKQHDGALGPARGGVSKRKRPAQEHGSGGGGSGAKRTAHSASARGGQLVCISAVDRQAAQALHTLLQADAGQGKGATLKALTLAPHITAKKATYAVTCEALKRERWPLVVRGASPWLHAFRRAVSRDAQTPWSCTHTRVPQTLRRCSRWCGGQGSCSGRAWTRCGGSRPPATAVPCPVANLEHHPRTPRTTALCSCPSAACTSCCTSCSSGRCVRAPPPWPLHASKRSRRLPSTRLPCCAPRGGLGPQGLGHKGPAERLIKTHQVRAPCPRPGRKDGRRAASELGTGDAGPPNVSGAPATMKRRRTCKRRCSTSSRRPARRCGDPWRCCPRCAPHPSSALHTSASAGCCSHPAPRHTIAERGGAAGQAGAARAARAPAVGARQHAQDVCRRRPQAPQGKRADQFHVWNHHQHQGPATQPPRRDAEHTRARSRAWGRRRSAWRRRRTRCCPTCCACPRARRCTHTRWCGRARWCCRARPAPCRRTRWRRRPAGPAWTAAPRRATRPRTSPPSCRSVGARPRVATGELQVAPQQDS